MSTPSGLTPEGTLVAFAQLLIRRLGEQPEAAANRAAALVAESKRLRRELARLSAVLAEGDALPSVLEAIRQRESRRAVISAELARLEQGGSRALEQLAT